jgi:hypothetical protein
MRKQLDDRPKRYLYYDDILGIWFRDYLGPAIILVTLIYLFLKAYVNTGF